MHSTTRCVPSICVIAEGGYGKSALVRRWTEQIASQNYLNIEVGFAYSFYQQGWEAGTAVSSTDFFSKCLAAMGGKSHGEVVKKGTAKQWMEEILVLLKTRRCLLVLDGLEPHQSPGGTSDDGVIKDPAR